MNQQNNETLENQQPVIGFKVDGKILNELSKQVSSHLFALGELMKNSYDAKATKINITLDLQANSITIEDNGTGISTDDIKSILHIARSGKEYGRAFNFNVGSEIVTRYTQGSKGLGLFAAFKFGNIVKWDTKSENQIYSILVNKEEVTELSDISNIQFPLLSGSRLENGTTITINLNPNDEEIVYIYNFFLDKTNSKKLANFFIADDITVNLTLINKLGITESGFPILSEKSIKSSTDLTNKRLFKISFSSETNIFEYTDQDNQTHNILFNREIKKTNYKIIFKVNAYSLNTGDKKNINSIFYNKKGELSPLVYINGVLFNNDQIFDPSINRGLKSDKVLSQLTGCIEIICFDPRLQFNNERTDLIDSSFNQQLRDDIASLNKFLQEKGKELERTIKKNKTKPDTDNTGDKPDTDNTGDKPGTDNTGDKPDTDNTGDKPGTDNTSDKPGTDNTSDKPGTDNTGDKPGTDNTGDKPGTDNTGDKPGTDNTGDKPDTDNTGGKPDTDNETDFTDTSYLKPFIKLTRTRHTINFQDHSGIINLQKYFESARDSKGVNIDFQNISISRDEKVLLSPIVPSIDTNQAIMYKFSFVDQFLTQDYEYPFVCQEFLTLIFNKKNKNFKSTNNTSDLIEPIGYSNYVINLEDINKLITQVNALWENHEEYDMCISASLRVIFDLANYHFELYNSTVALPKDLSDKVEFIINFIKSDNKNYSASTKLIGSRHSIVDNIFTDPKSFSKKASISNLGSHTGSVFLGKDTIKEIAMHAGYYAQLLDAYFKVKGFKNK
jgi:hypothetical protein